MKKVSIRSIAGTLNIGIATVSRALSGNGFVSEEMRSLIINEAHRRGYRSVVPVKRVAVVVSQAFCTGAYDMRLLNFSLRELSKAGYEALIVTECNIKLLSQIMFDAILSLCYYGKNNWELSEKFKLPIVGFNIFSKHSLKCYSINSDETEAIRSAINYFKEKGHTRIAAPHMFQRDFSHTTRKKTFLEYAGSLAMTPFVYQSEHATDFSDILDNIRHDNITALLLYNEDSQAKLLSCLRNSKIRVPEDLSIICWENPNITRYLDPPLTSFGQNFSAMAQKAVWTLDQLVKNKSQYLEDQFIPYSFYARKSVAAIPRNQRTAATAAK